MERDLFEFTTQETEKTLSAKWSQVARMLGLPSNRFGKYDLDENRLYIEVDYGDKIPLTVN